MLQKLIGSGAAPRIGAEGNEHTEARIAYRNGHHGKTLTTQAGDLDERPDSALSLPNATNATDD
ncbi:transposase [Streptomyces sp. NPDC005774]|uniref:transposase n=1 Tax=Streptomyces sp. NPDC005774 TaxID=3364728 RepID=UPI003678C46A